MVKENNTPTQNTPPPTTTNRLWKAAVGWRVWQDDVLREKEMNALAMSEAMVIAEEIKKLTAAVNNLSETMGYGFQEVWMSISKLHEQNFTADVSVHNDD